MLRVFRNALPRSEAAMTVTWRIWVRRVLGVAGMLAAIFAGLQLMRWALP